MCKQGLTLGEAEVSTETAQLQVNYYFQWYMYQFIKRKSTSAVI